MGRHEDREAPLSPLQLQQAEDIMDAASKESASKVFLISNRANTAESSGSSLGSSSEPWAESMNSCPISVLLMAWQACQAWEKESFPRTSIPFWTESRGSSQSLNLVVECQSI
jgi:hypothetical protein